MRPRNKQSGFTLIELLVVIGIITILLSLLLPALNKVREAAKGAQCLSNMRTIAVGEANYTVFNKGVFYPAPPSFSAGPTLTGASEIVFSNPNDVSPDPLCVCPAIYDYTQSYTLNGGTSQAASYAWNPWLGFMETQSSLFSPGPYLPIHPGSVPDSSEVAIFADIVDTTSSGLSFTSQASFNDPFWTTVLNNPGSTPALKLCRPVFHGRHNGRGSVLWMDGHASLEAPVPIPSSYTVTVSSSTGGFPEPASFYNQYHIGYLVRSPDDLSSVAGLYYYVFNKDALTTATLGSYLANNKALWR